MATAPRCTLTSFQTAVRAATTFATAYGRVGEVQLHMDVFAKWVGGPHSLVMALHTGGRHSSVQLRLRGAYGHQLTCSGRCPRIASPPMQQPARMKTQPCRGYDIISSRNTGRHRDPAQQDCTPRWRHLPQICWSQPAQSQPLQLALQPHHSIQLSRFASLDAISLQFGHITCLTTVFEPQTQSAVKTTVQRARATGAPSARI